MESKVWIYDSGCHNKCDFLENDKICKKLTTKLRDPNNNNRVYCDKHQKIVDDINEIKFESKIKEKEKSIKRLKENIIDELRKNIYLGNVDTCCARDVNEIINKIKNGDFDD